MPSKKYEENMYKYLQKRPQFSKFDCAGIYSMSLDGQVVYIGKSTNMLIRIAQHLVGIKAKSEHKYKILNEAQFCGLRVSFDVLYYAKRTTLSAIKEEIGKMEGEYIRAYRPPLNYQIPKAEDWTKFDVNASALTISLPELLEYNK